MSAIAIVSLIFGVYGTLFYEKKPSLTFEVISNTNVYDIHENVGKLDVIYDGQSIRAKKKLLKLINFRVVNSGKTNFIKSDYDEADALGFEINGGSILELPKFVASNDYLQENLKMILKSQQEIRINPLIFDAGEFIEIHALILANEGVEPILIPLGKVAGVKHIPVIESTLSRDRRSLWGQVIDADSIWVHVARAPVYSLFGLALLLLVILVFSLFSVPIKSFTDYKNKLQRHAEMERYSRDISLTVADRNVIERYLEGGSKAVLRLLRELDRISYRNDLVSKIGKVVDEGEMLGILSNAYPLNRSLIENLEKDGFISENGLLYMLEKDFERASNQLADYLRISSTEIKFSFLPEEVSFRPEWR
ncbi:MAG: hypothetical protein FP821_09285 [Sideroxydans sp.]|nr:hypothetical protein [Sideroxydans sp.]